MKVRNSKPGWMLLWVFGVPMPAVVLLLLLRELTGADAPAKQRRA